MNAQLVQLAQHYREGVGEECLVCDLTLIGVWTDYNGEIRCQVCGTTYQVLGCHLAKEGLIELMLEPKEVAQRYCNVFGIVPILRDYWHATRRPVPLGQYFGGSPIPKEDYQDFYGWLAARADVYRPEYPDDFDWDAMLRRHARN